MPDLLLIIQDDVEELKERLNRHEEAHTADTRLLASIVDTLSEHQNNHHSRSSVLKQNGIVGVILTMFYLVVESLRQFVF